MKLYPPKVEGIIPSFSHTEGEGTVITVPFSMNKAVSQSEVSGFKIKIKNVVSNAEIIEVSSTGHDFKKGEAYFSLLASEATELKQGCFYKIQMAYVDTSASPQTGYYSTVGVAKCTGEIKTEIVNLKSNQSNLHAYNYSGHFYHEDVSEKAYNYQFIVSNENGEIIADSGEKVHNVALDEQVNDSYDAYELDIELEDEEIYFIQYIVTTNNQLVSASPKYKIVQETLQEMQEPLTVKTELNFDNGYITISVGLLPEKEEELTYKIIKLNSLSYQKNTYYIKENNKYILCSENKYDRKKEYYQKVLPIYYTQGNYIITRASSDTGYKQWTKIRTILINGRGPIYSVQKDFTIEQGKKYKYAIQEFNNSGVISKRRESSIIFADFEDMFISDGQKQLRVRFNPKVSSFQDKIQEAKTETIGYRYPIFFRNGQIQYKEFPITGLISYKMDEDENLFMTKSSLGFNYDYDYMERNANVEYQEKYLKERKATIENIFKSTKELQKYNMQQRKALKEERKEIIGLLTEIETNNLRTHKQILDRQEFPTHNLVGQNIAAERKFKMEVLSWLNNGKPKVFRSPAEGNFIVRLMLVSMSPEDSLGRMLHNFSATADEIADYTYNNLLYYNLIEEDEVTLDYKLWTTVLFAEANPAILNNQQEDDNFKYIELDNTDYYPEADDFPEVIYNEGELLPEGRVAYTLKVMDAMPGSVIRIDGEDFQIGATGSYYMEKEEGIKSIYIYPDSNYFFGSVTYSYNGVSKTKLSLIDSQTVKDRACHQFIGAYNNILKEIENIKINVSLFYNLRFFNREIIKVKDFSKEENYFSDLYYNNIYLLISDYDKYKDSLYIQNEDESVEGGDLIPAKDSSFNSNYSYIYILQDENGNDVSKNVNFIRSYSDLDEEECYKQTNCYVTPIIDEEPDAAKMLIQNPRPLYNYKQSSFAFGEKSVELPQEINVYKDINVDGIYLDEEGFALFKKAMLDKYSEQDFIKEFNKYLREKFNYKGPDFKFVTSEVYINEDNHKVSLDEVILNSYADILSYEIQIDDNVIDLACEQHYDLLKGEYQFEKIKISNGNIAELSYKIKEITYDFEKNIEDELLKNYKEALERCINKINLSESEFFLDATKLKDILEGLRKEAIANLKNSPDDFDFEENFESYLDFLDLYKSYLAGEINITSINASEYPILKDFINKIEKEQQNALDNYKKIYNLYISRVEYLFNKEKEDDYE